MAFVVKTIVEIAKNSNVKYEITNGKLIIDRIMFGDFKYPQNYGFIENTLDWDGDPLDVMIIADAKLMPTSIVDVRVVGAMKMIDDGETDTKLIGYIDSDPNHKEKNNLDHVQKKVLKEIKDFFTNYKKYKKVEVKISGFEDDRFAKQELIIAKKLFNQYHNMAKKEFIQKMMKLYPKKYQK